MYHTQKRLLLAVSTLALAAMTFSYRAHSQIAASPTPSVSSSASPSSSPSASSTPLTAGNLRQIYTAELSPQNVGFNASGFSGTGTVVLVVDGPSFGVYATESGLDPNVIHMAHIRENNQCATLSADTNGDGVVDVTEAAAVEGGILIPLDSNLNTFTTDLANALLNTGISLFPTSNSSGAITYIGSGNLSTIMAEVSRENPGPGFASIPVSQWNPANWSIDIAGVDPSVQLPSTVQTLPGLTANETLPVACGVIVQQSGPVTPTASPSPSPTASPSPSPSATATSGAT